ncbi:DNA cross-link repair 1A protein [Oryzias melastigma]|uniref:DNA cross-link repair 1A protein n=1 Tax=Oryzias melastigma TaxID=30732 RepID=A0A834CBZ9_ORYME|nr:DNA cross-link repair 1A protein [Oryzias melastigma]
MSQRDDSENDIWEYKPLQKKRKRNDSPSGTSRRSTSKKTKKQTSVSVKSNTNNKAAESRNRTTTGNVDTRISSKSHNVPLNASQTKDSTQSDSNAASEEPSEDFCPVCQMPFSILVVQTQRWHIAECLDNIKDTCKECPDGLQCSSTIPSHYKNFNHTLLAHSRANSDTAILTRSRDAAVSPSQVTVCTFGESQASSPPSSSHSLTGTPPSKPTNGLLLLRSPGPEDFKKKKGWSTKHHKSIVSSQELSSTPVKENTPPEACDPLPEEESNSKDDEEISFSPLSELPETLFNSDACKNENSMTLFNDSFSEDELLVDFIDGNVDATGVPGRNPASSDAHLLSVSSLARNQEAASSFAANRDKSDGNECNLMKSPQSLVLENLRDTLQSSQFEVQPEQSMPPQKGIKTAGQASGLKQMDIGLFFGLKPLKEKKKKEEVLDSSSVPPAGEDAGGRRQRRTGQSRRVTKTPGDKDPDLSSASGQQETARGGSRGWRRKGWSRVNADGEVQLPRCPFYKKIPGTKFAIDAFQYGKIEGISAYFLTHFHSDHYGGLTKSSTVPIYCNKITGNLVKSKLRVPEEYVHILPMNTEVVVEGVRLRLLDANHCPGAAMLLFFLPDGQTVLHTGDFRADPSMETYPELLGCRVQTLYLDTTYCSPEYTFPRQQEVINFAANRAFESVTLNPRTLVVCGSYSVGKEKVFLALAEVLGSKVCLSKDKYNTMCCLESEQIKKQITTDWKGAQVHVLPMMHLNFKKLQDHLARFSSQYDQLVAFKPTGWTFSQQVESVEDIQPQISGKISIYGVPYSEHSSFLELKRFVQWLRPLKIIPTVNVGSWASRKAMEECFREWLTETKR